jgi:lipid A disaccharide synthetase
MLGSMRSYHDKVNVPISIGDAHQQATRSDLVLVASGTAALELALLGVPMVVVYKLSAMSYWIAKRLVTIAYVSLPNIIAGEYLVPELIQNDANPDNIAQQAIAILQSDTTALIPATFSSFNKLADTSPVPMSSFNANATTLSTVGLFMNKIHNNAC